MSELQMRVSDDDRERTTRRIQQAFTEGRLTHAELEDRLELALTAKTHGDLVPLVGDLPAPVPAAPDVVTLESAYGHVKRSGDWPVPRRMRIVSKYGGVELDFTETEVHHPVVEIDLDLIYGSAKILLPEGAAANVDAFQTDFGHQKTSVPGRPQPGALYLMISGRSKYGGLTVRYPRRRRLTH
jgi:hypothetical protein